MFKSASNPCQIGVLCHLQPDCVTTADMPQDTFYKTRKWRATRAVHLAQHPFCAICAAIRIQTFATEVDHVYSKESMADPYDHAGLRSLCKPHHSAKTIALDGQHKDKKPFHITGPDGFPVPYRDQ